MMVTEKTEKGSSEVAIGDVRMPSRPESRDIRSLRVLIIDDEQIVHEVLGQFLRNLGHQIFEAYEGTAGLKMLNDSEFDLLLLDDNMPGIRGMEVLGKVREANPEIIVVMITGYGTMTMVIEALRLGADDFLTKPIRLNELETVIEKTKKIRQLRRDNRRLRAAIKYLQSMSPYDNGAGSCLIGESENLQQVRREIDLAVSAACDSILITGETGTGKEVVAREIHAQADRGKNPFIAVSCPAIPESLVESELFGHVKGSFTGAAESRSGCFELANNGTLFLDEIGDLSQLAQAKILRALETRTIRRVGGVKEYPVEVRVVAATNIPLTDLVEQRKFRKDLLYRLNAFSIYLSPLRERRKDIRPLSEYFLEYFARSRNYKIEGFSDQAMNMLESYNFPGNVRELKHLVERAAIVARCDRIGVEHLPLPVASAPKATTQSPLKEENGDRELIVRTLEKTKWNRRETAKILNIPYSTLRYKIDKYNIK